MRSWVLAAATAAILLPACAQAQGYDPDDGRPPPPPGFGRPPPPPPPPFGWPPPPRYGYRPGPPLLCRTEEGSCRSGAPQAYRARCLCDFGYGPVPGRMK